MEIQIALLEFENGKTNNEVLKIFKDKIFDTFHQGNLANWVKVDTRIMSTKLYLNGSNN